MANQLVSNSGFGKHSPGWVWGLARYQRQANGLVAKSEIMKKWKKTPCGKEESNRGVFTFPQYTHYLFLFHHLLLLANQSAHLGTLEAKLRLFQHKADLLAWPLNCTQSIWHFHKWSWGWWCNAINNYHIIQASIASHVTSYRAGLLVIRLQIELQA